MSDLVLELDDVTAGYGDVPVIRNVHLVVAAGEVVALLGANGAGKTTTLRIASRILTPLSGRIRFLGSEAGKLAPQEISRRGMAHVPEGHGVFFGLTVAEHFRLLPGGQRPTDDEAYAYFPALRDLRNRKAGLLSGGEQQMLALALALARRPKLLLVDELSLGLAPVIVERLLPVVRQAATETGAGVLLVEQHVHLALEVADRGYVMSHGEVVLESSTEQLRGDRELIESSYLGKATAVDNQLPSK